MFTRKDLLRLILPLVIEQILAVTIGLADTVMVASVGEAAVSSISLVDSINVLLINVFSSLATGGAVIASQYLGHGDREACCISAKQLYLSIFALSLMISVAALLFCEPILRGVFGSIEDNILDGAKIYFTISAVSYPFLAVYNASAALFRSMNNSKISMLTSALMNLVNISGNALLIYGLKLGVAGAGLATLTSRILGAVIMTILIIRPENPIHIDNLRDWRPHFSMIRRILRVGIPTGLEGGIFQIGKVLVQSLISSFGTSAIAANAMAGSVISLAFVPGSSIGLAMITVIGQCVGAKNYTEAKKYTVRLVTVTYLSMGILNMLVFFLAPTVTQFFNLSAESSRIAVQLVQYHSIAAILIWPTAFTLPNALRAAGDAKFTMLVSVSTMWIFRIGLSYVLALGAGLGVLGVWLAMFCDWIVRAIIFAFRFRSGKWLTKRVIE